MLPPAASSQCKKNLTKTIKFRNLMLWLRVAIFLSKQNLVPNPNEE